VIKKPDRRVIKSIRRNHLVAKERVDVRARKIQQKVTNIRRGQLVQRAGAKTPKVKHTLISANRVNRPLLQVKRDETKPKRTVKLRAENQGQAGRESESVSRRAPRKPVKRQAVQRKDPQQARNDVKGVQLRQRPTPVTPQKVRAQNQRQDRRKLETASRHLPRKPVKRQEVQRKDPQQARNDVKGVQPRQRPTPVTPQKVRAQNQRQPSKVLAKVQKSTRLSAPNQQREPVSQGFQERQESRDTRQDRQIQEPQPRQENTRRDAKRQKNVAGWTSEPYTPYPKGTGRPSPRFGSMGSRHTRHQ
jgi:hypothetical protein